MMTKRFLFFLLSKFTLALLVMVTLSAEEAQRCNVRGKEVSNCDPYSSKFLFAKKVVYQKDNNKLIMTKTLPKPAKKSLKVFSVVDTIEKYVKVEKPIRYEGSDKRDLEALHIESAKDSNRYSIAREIEERRKKFIEELVASQKKAYEAGEMCQNASQEKAETKKAPKEGVYTIAKGDTLDSVAKKFHISVSTLQALNHLDKESFPRVREKLTLPLTQVKLDTIATGKYTIQPGDTVSTIARDYNLSTADLLKYNHLTRDSVICVGKKLVMPFPHKMEALEKEYRAYEKKRKTERKRSRFARGYGKRKLRVTATAYSSHHNQTDSTPFLAAWNNRLRPGMKIIAVSRDLLTQYGLRNGSKVRISGLRGYYTVRDKMNKRYRKRIDIYMGTNRRRALRWGRRSVVIYF